MSCYIWYSEGGHRRAAVTPQSPPRCTKCSPTNGQCTNFILFDVALWLAVWLSGIRWSRSTYSCSTLGPVSAWMCDRLRAGKPSWYATSHPGQLSLAIPPRVGALSTSLGWEGNLRSGVALDMRHRQYYSGPFTHLRAQQPVREMSTPPTLLLGYGIITFAITFLKG